MIYKAVGSSVYRELVCQASESDSLQCSLIRHQTNKTVRRKETEDRSPNIVSLSKPIQTQCTI